MELKRWPSFLAMTFMLSFRAFALAQELNDKPDVPRLESPATEGAIVEDNAKDEQDKSTNSGQSPAINLIDLLTQDAPGEVPPAELPKYMIGVSLTEVPASLRAHIKLEEGQGLMVGTVIPDSPAAKAGLQQYDIILKSGDQALKHPKELQTLVDSAEDKPVSITVQRQGEHKVIEITPVKREVLKASHSQLPMGNDPLGASFDNLIRSPRIYRLADGRAVIMANPDVNPVLQSPPMNTAQIDSLTLSIQALTQQVERLQQAIDRLEKQAEKPEALPQDEKSEKAP